MTTQEWKIQILEKYVKENNPPQYEVEHILDFLDKTKPRVSSRVSYESIREKSIQWTEELNKVNENLTSSGEVKKVMNFPGGYYIAHLTSQAAKDWEGLHMGHCVASYKNHEGIYSLRDKNNLPHCTIEVEKNEIRQVKGKANLSVSVKYHEMILAFLESLNLPLKGNLCFLYAQTSRNKVLPDLFSGVKVVKIANKEYLYINQSKFNSIQPVNVANRELLELLIEYPFNPELLKTLVNLEPGVVDLLDGHLVAFDHFDVIIESIVEKKDWVYLFEFVNKIKLKETNNSSLKYSVASLLKDHLPVLCEVINSKFISFTDGFRFSGISDRDDLESFLFLKEQCNPSQCELTKALEKSFKSEGNKIRNYLFDEKIPFTEENIKCLYPKYYKKKLLEVLPHCSFLLPVQVMISAIDEKMSEVAKYLIDNKRLNFDVLDYALNYDDKAVLAYLRTQKLIKPVYEIRIEERQKFWDAGFEIIASFPGGEKIIKYLSKETFDAAIKKEKDWYKSQARETTHNSRYGFMLADGSMLFFARGEWFNSVDCLMFFDTGKTKYQYAEMFINVLIKNKISHPCHFIKDLGYVPVNVFQFSQKTRQTIFEYAQAVPEKFIFGNLYWYFGPDIKLTKKVKSVKVLEDLMYSSEYISRFPSNLCLVVTALESFLKYRENHPLRFFRRMFNKETKENQRLLNLVTRIKSYGDTENELNAKALLDEYGVTV